MIKADGFGTYEVVCRYCKEEHTVTIYPDYCCMCGKKINKAGEGNKR